MTVLFQAPHRVMFLAGSVQILVVIGWWAAELAARAGWLPMWPWPLYPGWLHGVWLIYGLYPFFFFGFLMTAMPRWQNAAAVSARVYLTVFCLCGVGWLAFAAGLLFPKVLPAALAAVLLGWAVALIDLLRVANTPHPDRVVPRIVVAAFSAGVLGLVLLLARTLGADESALRAALDIGSWWFL
ncbi:MAG: NnrS family protein, partial [Rhodocyclaceae bacterium]